MTAYNMHWQAPCSDARRVTVTRSDVRVSPNLAS